MGTQEVSLQPSVNQPVLQALRCGFSAWRTGEFEACEKRDVCLIRALLGSKNCSPQITADCLC